MIDFNSSKPKKLELSKVVPASVNKIIRNQQQQQKLKRFNNGGEIQKYEGGWPIIPNWIVNGLTAIHPTFSAPAMFYNYYAIKNNNSSTNNTSRTNSGNVSRNENRPVIRSRRRNYSSVSQPTVETTPSTTTSAPEYVSTWTAPYEPIKLNFTPMPYYQFNSYFGQRTQPKVYDRTMTRDWFEQVGLSPYDYTGSVRRAVRMAINGELGDNEIAILKQNPEILEKLYGSNWNNEIEKDRKKLQDGGILSFRRGGRKRRRNTNNGLFGRTSLLINNPTARLQYQLYKQGYFGNISYEKAVDGIMGPLTKAAMKRAETAQNHIQQQNTGNQSTYNRNIWRPELKAGQICNTKECAQWANDTLRNFRDSNNNRIYSYDEIGGDAWTRLSAGKHAKMVYSGYDGMEYDPANYSEAQSNQRNWAASNNLRRNFNSKTLDKNKIYIVNMYYNNSPNKRKAWENATNGTTGTHTGNLYWNPETNSWRIAHNIHGVLHDDDFIQAQGSRNKFGYGVTAIAEAPTVKEVWDQEHPIKAAINKVYDFGMWKKGGKIVKAQNGISLPEVTVTGVDTRKFKGNNLAYKYAEAFNKFRPHIMDRYNLTDQQYADLSKFGINIAQRESNLGQSKEYKIKTRLPDVLLHFYKKYIRRNSTGDTPNSRGLTQIKYQSDIKDPELKNEYDYFGITERNLINPQRAALATASRYVINNKRLNLDNKTYHYSDGTEMPDDVAQAIYWNRGRLTDYKNPNITNLDVGGATGYARRFENQKIIK